MLAVQAHAQEYQGTGKSGETARHAHYNEILERPLFSDTRRPVGIPVNPSSPATDIDLALHGVAIAPGRKVAVVGFGVPATVHIVAEGQKVAHWTIERIESDRIIVRSSESAVTVRVKDTRPSATKKADDMSVGVKNRPAR
jgi:hypothetical protein